MRNYDELIQGFESILGIKKDIKDFARSLEYELLEVDTMPQDYFNFYIKILSNISFINVSGVEKIIFALYNDFEKLNESQKLMLLQTVIDNAEIYKNDLIIYFISDILARKYQEKERKVLLDNISNEMMKESVIKISNGKI